MIVNNRCTDHPIGGGLGAAGWFADWVRDGIDDRAPATSDLVLRTTLDSRLQAAVESRLDALLAGPGFSKGVDVILAEVKTREVELARRELELGEREGAVKELEAMVAERAGELERIRAEVKTRILAWSAQGQDRIEQLSGVYSAMPPADAAALLGKLELDLAVSVIRQMKKKVSASVLAAMKPDRALLVSRRILQPLDPATDAPPARPY